MPRYAILCKQSQTFTKLQSRLGHGAEHTVRHLPDPLAQNNIKPQQIVSWRYSSVHLPIGIFSVGQKAEADTQPHRASSCLITFEEFLCHPSDFLSTIVDN